MKRVRFMHSRNGLGWKQFVIAVLLCYPIGLLAQEESEQGWVKSDIASQWNALTTSDKEYTFNKNLWTYLRFDEVPSAEQKELLKQLDVGLYQYQPDLIWFASLPLQVDLNRLRSAGVSQVFVKPLSQKADQRILRREIPTYAQKGSGVEATVVVAATGEYEKINSRLEAEGASVSGVFAPLGLIKVTASETALATIANLPFVIYVELPDPPAELEFEDEISLARGAYINGYYNLDGLNGKGISIAVNEGGIFDTVHNPNLKNRLDRSLEPGNGNVSGHKTGVGLRMASAGNINPIHRGEAWGAELISGGVNFTNAAQNNVNIVNNSFGYGCISGGSTYNSGAATNDFLVRTYERFMITYSCGNIGASTCANYGAGPGWGNITGLVKSAKNIFAVGAMNTNDNLTGFSSRGPAMDGRILPDITAAGPGGTSHASPNLAGINALLTEAYRNENNSQWPNSGLIKAIILNTADDIENPGPDFKTGFGRVNARRALEVVVNDQFLSDSVSSTGVKTHSITVPAGVSQLKVSLYWNDREATPGITGKTLINNLDLRLQIPGGTWVQPWVLNSFPHTDSLDAFAIRGTDTLNNVELITIDTPTAGTYIPEVTGTLVPFGPQVYRIVYSFVYDTIQVIYPRGGEGLVPGENRRIRWDAFDSGNTFDIEYSSDSGANWQSIVSGVASDIRSYNWSIPNEVSDNCLIRVRSLTQQALSDSRFTIADAPSNLALVWRCADSAIFSWDTVPGAIAYRVYRLGNEYMDTVGVTSDAHFQLYNLSATDEEWVSVQAILPDSGGSRRAVAISIAPGDYNCVPFDLALNEITSPTSGYLPNCLTADSMDVELRLKNTGVSTLPYLPIAFQINGGTAILDTLFSSLKSAKENVFVFPKAVLLQVGPNDIVAWTTYPGDGNLANDTFEISILVYPGSSRSLPYVQDFDNFTSCSTAWGCASVTCGLFQGWYNVPNLAGVDSIDWRTHSGATGTGSTGPSADHTSGNGKYLYLEGSGNGGSGCSNKEAKGHSPCFDLAGTNEPTLSYWYHARGSGIGSLHVDVFSEGKWHLDVAPVVSGAQGNQWFQQKADLSAFQGQDVLIRFRGTTAGGFRSDLAIDDINLTTLPLAQFETLYDTFCLGQQVQLQNTTTYGNSYRWTVTPATFSYVSGNDSSMTPTLLPSDTGWYTIQLIATNATGSDTLMTQQKFYVGSADRLKLTTDGLNDTYCFGDSATFTASGLGYGYNFLYNTNSVQSGADTSWTAFPVLHGDSVQVEHHINAGCTLTGPAIQVRVQPDLNGTSIWSNDADLTICEGDTVEMGTQPGLSNYDFYQNSTSISNGTDSIIQTHQLVDGDMIYVEITDSLGCLGITDTLLWTVNPIPGTPSISDIGNDSLMASVIASQYAWWRDLQLLADTIQSILATQNGDYQVRVTELDCSSEISDPFSYELLGIAEQSSESIRIYPNPVSDQLYIVLEKSDMDQLRLLDQTGKVVLTQKAIVGQNTLDLGHLASGTYVLQVYGKTGRTEYNIVVR